MQIIKYLVDVEKNKKKKTNLWTDQRERLRLIYWELWYTMYMLVLTNNFLHFCYSCINHYARYRYILNWVFKLRLFFCQM